MSRLTDERYAELCGDLQFASVFQLGGLVKRAGIAVEVAAMGSATKEESAEDLVTFGGVEAKQIKYVWDICQDIANSILHRGRTPQYLKSVALLLLGTAAVESGLTVRRQVPFPPNNKGGFGLWQIEKGSVETSLPYLERVDRLPQWLKTLIVGKTPLELLACFAYSGTISSGPELTTIRYPSINDRLCCAFARTHYYWMSPNPIPIAVTPGGHLLSVVDGWLSKHGWLSEHARYWKQCYNTPLGAGTEERYIETFKQVCLPFLDSIA